MRDAERLRAALPPDVLEILDRNEQAGTTDSEEYKKANQEYTKRHVCRLETYPPRLKEALAATNRAVYQAMWGPSESHPTGNLKGYDCSERLHEIQVPLLFITGRFDEATPETTAWYRGFVPGARLVVIENGSHLAMYEAPDEYIQVIREFLRSVEAGD